MSRNRETCLTHGTGPGQRNYNFKEPPCKKNDSGPGCSASRMWCEATSNLSHVQTQVLTNVEQKIHLSPHRCSLSSFFFLFFVEIETICFTRQEKGEIFLTQYAHAGVQEGMRAPRRSCSWLSLQRHHQVHVLKCLLLPAQRPQCLSLTTKCEHANETNATETDWSRNLWTREGTNGSYDQFCYIKMIFHFKNNHSNCNVAKKSSASVSSKTLVQTQLIESKK